MQLESVSIKPSGVKELGVFNRHNQYKCFSNKTLYLFGCRILQGNRDSVKKENIQTREKLYNVKT